MDSGRIRFNPSSCVLSKKSEAYGTVHWRIYGRAPPPLNGKKKKSQMDEKPAGQVKQNHPHTPHPHPPSSRSEFATAVKEVNTTEKIDCGFFCDYPLTKITLACLPMPRKLFPISMYRQCIGQNRNMGNSFSLYVRLGSSQYLELFGLIILKRNGNEINAPRKHLQNAYSFIMSLQPNRFA